MKKFWNFASGNDGNVLELFGDIDSDDWWGEGIVTARGFRADMAPMQGDLHVLINSRGGDVFTGADIYTALREYSASKGAVTVYITGLAASAASVVAMAGDRVLMSQVATMMVHDPWTSLRGNASELRQMADALDTVRDSLAAAYVARTGLSANEINDMLAKETWMNAQQAIEYGFADGFGLYGAENAGGAAAKAWNYSGRNDMQCAKVAAAVQEGKELPAALADSMQSMRRAALRYVTDQRKNFEPSNKQQRRMAMQLKARCI